jgi:hypothetical protein
MRKNNDIKASDGYLLGGLRRVRIDGTILFQRVWWELPKETKSRFVGQNVWVHIHESYGACAIHRGETILEVAEPNLHIYRAKLERKVVIARRNKRPEAKSGTRLQ